MRTLTLIPGNDKRIRTQITLGKELKRAVEKHAEKTGESLSEYLRKAALVRLLLESEKEKDLTKVSQRVIGSVDLKNHPEWKTKGHIQRWVRNIRQEW